ncbi:endonuclease/exonuclease/phosphatase family protein [Oceanospirillum beijerinckii]|uniref:endonuclease/exonuclease/phosphatase family protein n=1 Tax=Oceanospirillum beijerinckii TaxID=64976 RepID=UPI0003FFE273|nr:endonuclease/exonuclease/phosphatase family protein [Oceanospirillum beijerinckii]
MKIVTWNCNGALRKKLDKLNELNADIYIIQECEDPERTKHSAYQQWAANYIWKGPTKNKGIAIFAQEDIEIQYLSWPSGTLELFLPVRINDSFNLVAVWTRQANSPNFRYIGQFWKFLQEHWPKMAREPVIIAGDFNSNSRWDEWDRWWNHSDVVNQLASLGINSLYHDWFQEQQSQETRPTLFLQRKAEKPYHIDYVFLSRRLEEKVSSLAVGQYDHWIDSSDHMPITFELG